MMDMIKAKDSLRQYKIIRREYDDKGPVGDDQEVDVIKAVNAYAALESYWVACGGGEGIFTTHKMNNPESAGVIVAYGVQYIATLMS